MPPLKEQEKKRIIERAQKELSEIQRTVYRDDFEKLSRELVRYIKDIDSRISKDLDEVKGITAKERESLKQSFKETVNTLKEDFKEKFTQLTKEQQAGMNAVTDRFNRIENRIKSEITNDLADMIPETPEMPEIPEAVDIKPLEEKLEAFMKEIREELQNVKARKAGTIGGGVTDMRIRQAMKNIMHTEAPSGDIDGANTTYTVNHTIFAIVDFSLNGESIPELPNYSYTGRTITFDTALPAAYSGKDFEIRYFG
jgi:gas vesicle protein